MNIPFLVTKNEKNKSMLWLRLSQEGALRKIMRLAGGHLQRIEQADDSGRWRVRFKQPTDRKRKYCERVVKLAGEIWDQVGKDVAIAARNKGTCTIKLSKLMACCDGTPGRRDLTTALDILSQLRLLHTNESLFPRAYFLELKKPNQPLNMDAIKEQIEAINEMAELREWAMHTFCLISKQSHSRFIREYFNQGSPEKLRQFLMVFLGKESSQEKLSEADVKKIIQLREKIDPAYIKQQFDNVFDKHRAYEAQWKAITKAPDSHVLVNAGPGSGKTTVLIARIIYLIKERGIHPDEIMVLAFNRAVVHEIRQRTRDVFEKVGYGRYAKSLRVSTFHALAARNIDCADSIERQNILGNFNVQLNTGMAKSIAGNVKVILVDEFQDMNDARWSIIQKLHKTNNPGIFAIGDDDQDISAWDRSGEGCKKYFRAFDKKYSPVKLFLNMNFRSARKIVAESQERISEWGCLRDKKDLSLKAHRKEDGFVQVEKDCSEQNVRTIAASEIRDAKERGKSIAILCRSNSEVAEWHTKLEKEFPGLEVQGSASYQLSWMRHIAMWLDIFKKYDENKRLDDDLYNNVRDEWLDLDIPEARDAKHRHGEGQYLIELEQLWKWVNEEKVNARVIDVIEFVEDLDTDDYRKMESMGSVKQQFKAVISTIHKVKGLEFDRVIILPSHVNFPFVNQHADLECEAESEAKLLYVGMTRAKKNIRYFMGSREEKWSQKQKSRFVGLSSDTKVLTGAIDNLFIGRSGWSEPMQDYIERNIQLYSDVTLDGNKLKDKGQLLGQIRTSMGYGYSSYLKVAAVIRYPQNKEQQFYQSMPGLYDRLDKTVREQGWCWIVCVKGFYDSE